MVPEAERSEPERYSRLPGAPAVGVESPDTPFKQPEFPVPPTDHSVFGARCVVKSRPTVAGRPALSSPPHTWTLVM